MGPKARNFRYQSERSGPDKPKKVARPRTADRKNLSVHAARKGGVALEESETTPSRKSTRRGKGRTVTMSANADGIPSKRTSEGHVKAAANLSLRAMVKARSPEQRAQRKQGR